MGKSIRDYIDKELLQAYDNSVGFDLSDLEEFYKTTYQAELAAVVDDPEVSVYNTSIPGVSGEKDIELRVYKPVNASDKMPAVLWFHGGGYVFGSMYRQNDFCNRYAKNVGCVVISVEYRLAPQYKAPAPVEDAYVTLLAVAENASEYGVDPDKIAIMGISAGGGICAALALMTRDRKGPKPVLQMPLYAELDYRMNTASAKDILDPRVWSTPYSEISWGAYLDKTKEVDYYASPSLCENFDGIAPIFSYVGNLDPFRDENIAYWQKAMEANITVEAHIIPGAYHVFETSVPDAAVSRFVYHAGYSALKRAFGLL